MLKRRQFLQSIATAGALLGLPRVAHSTPASGRKFLFVITEGGWDPLCVFAPLFDATAIDMESEAAPMSIGDFRLVDHPERPAVRSFFETWGSSTLVIDGISTRSVSHEVCAEIALTGSSSGSAADWPTLIALAEQERYAMPSLVFSGLDRAFAPTFPGDHEVVVVRTGPNNELQSMLHGHYIEETDFPVEPLPEHARSILDRFVLQRSQVLEPQFTRRGGGKLLRDFRQSLEQVKQLKSLSQELDLTTEEGGLPKGSLPIESAVSALSMGLCRCVTMTDGRDWDTHEDNAPQNDHFQGIFSDLNTLLVTMANTPGTQGLSLLDETVVVVMSEMGRTPKFNSTGGRDHWPYTSAMLIGNFIDGGRSLGGYTENFSGVGFDPNTGALIPDALGVSSADFGATLLTMADIDPGPVLAGALPFKGLIK